MTAAPRSSGWIYAITCDMYDHDGLIKLGYTEKPDLLEEQVRTSLIQRYATTLIQPRIIALVKVAYPKQAEKALFDRLKNYKFSKEIFKCSYQQDVAPALQWLVTEYCPTSPYEIRFEVLEKLMCRLRKKDKRLARELRYQRDVCDWMMREASKLTFPNQQIVYNFINMMPMPHIHTTGQEWYQIQQNIHVLPMRLSHIHQTFFPNNWDRKDPELHSFVKRLLDNC